jgi:ubiquinone biosynthesis protein COQ4
MARSALGTLLIVPPRRTVRTRVCGGVWRRATPVLRNSSRCEFRTFRRSSVVGTCCEEPLGISSQHGKQLHTVAAFPAAQNDTMSAAARPCLCSSAGFPVASASGWWLSPLPPSPLSSSAPPRARQFATFSNTRVGLAVEAAVNAFLDPKRDDAVAALGELTGETALRSIHAAMMADSVGSRIVRERWLISESSIHPQKLRALPTGTFGRCYANFLDRHGFSPDERKPVRHVADPELAYVMQRYRQVHDFWHVLCGVEPTVLGEVAIKWFEMVQTGLPVATLSAFAGPLRLPAADFAQLWSFYVPWATRSARNAAFLMNVPYEEHLATDVATLRTQLRIEPFDADAYLHPVQAADGTESGAHAPGSTPTVAVDTKDARISNNVA